MWSTYKTNKGIIYVIESHMLALEKSIDCGYCIMEEWDE